MPPIHPWRTLGSLGIVYQTLGNHGEAVTHARYTPSP